jgi:predicted DNA-binding protein
MTTSMIVRIDRDTKERFYRAARGEGKTASEKLRELMETYVRKADMSEVVDSIWDGIGKRLRRKDVGKAIRAVRSAR